MASRDKELREIREAGLLADPDVMRSLGIDVPLRHDVHNVGGHRVSSLV